MNELYIQRFIRSNGEETALAHIADVLNIDIRYSETDGRVLFKYNQLYSPMHNKIVQESRGLILDRNNGWKVVSFPFKKFFNREESHAHALQMKTARVLEKVDGCLDGNTILQTEDGEKTIKEICEYKYDRKIATFDVDTGKIYMDNIVNYFITENDDKDWYELEIEDGRVVKLTGNHMVWLPDFHCYRRVDELKGDENILLKK